MAKTTWRDNQYQAGFDGIDTVRAYFNSTPTTGVDIYLKVPQADGSTKTYTVYENFVGPYKTIKVKSAWVVNGDFSINGTYYDQYEKYQSVLYTTLIVKSSGGTDTTNFIIYANLNFKVTGYTLYNTDDISRNLGYWNDNSIFKLDVKYSLDIDVGISWQISGAGGVGSVVTKPSDRVMTFTSAYTMDAYYNDSGTLWNTNGNNIYFVPKTLNDGFFAEGFDFWYKLPPLIKMAKTPTQFKLSSNYSPDTSNTTANITGTWGNDTDTLYATVNQNNFYGDVYIKKDSDSDYTWLFGTTVNAKSQNFTINNMNAEIAYTVRVDMYTGYSTISNTIRLQSLSVTVDYRKGGKGVAIGGVSLEDNFTVYMASKFASEVELLKNMTVQGSLEVTSRLTANGGVYTGWIWSTMGNNNGDYNFTRTNDSAKVYVDNLYTHKFAVSGDVDSGVLTVESPFVEYSSGTKSAVHYTRFGTMVVLSGVLKNTYDINSGSTATIAYLPDSLIPSYNCGTLQQGTGSNHWTSFVGTNGQLQLQRYGNSGSYKTASAGSWFPFSISYSLV